MYERRWKLYRLIPAEGGRHIPLPAHTKEGEPTQEVIFKGCNDRVITDLDFSAFTGHENILVEFACPYLPMSQIGELLGMPDDTKADVAKMEASGLSTLDIAKKLGMDAEALDRFDDAARDARAGRDPAAIKKREDDGKAITVAKIQAIADDLKKELAAAGAAIATLKNERDYFRDKASVPVREAEILAERLGAITGSIEEVEGDTLEDKIALLLGSWRLVHNDEDDDADGAPAAQAGKIRRRKVITKDA